MDVTCPRCQTDYEFDDALVSERGTTVKCTNCGHQFRVFRPRPSGSSGAAAQPPAPELWRIERKTGEPLELRSLVELQRAIRAGRVSREDLLRRGEGAARRVGDIPELEPFFPSVREGSGVREGSAPTTLPMLSGAEPIVREAPPRPPAHTPQYGNKPPSNPPPPPIQISGTMRPGGAPPPPARTSGGNGDRIPPAPRLPTPLGLHPPNDSARPPGPPPPRTPVPVAAEADPPTVRRSDNTGPRAATSVPPRPMPASLPPREESREESYESMFPSPKKNRGGATWIVALVVVGAVALLGATVGRSYLAKMGGGAAASTSASNDRLSRELVAGDRAATDGDMAGAREAFMKATVIDDKSLAAWDGLCTAESELAVAHWIAALAGHSALERDQAASIGGSAGSSCARWSELARIGPDGNKKVSSDLRPVRAVAAQNDGPGVRVYLPAHPGNGIVGALAYLADVPKGDDKALPAALKSAQGSLASVEIEKLTSPADLALVAYAAGSAGNSVRLQTALTELAKRSPRHALLETLRGLGATPAADAGATDAPPASADTGAPDAHSTTAAVVGTTTGAPTATGGGTDTPTGDYRSLNEKGHKALASGEVAKAESFFRAALSQHPGDVDALYGLGQIARSRGDHPNAISYFKQVLDTSAGFAPARLALADEQWATGDQASAGKNYELYLERVSEGSGADRARSRLGKEKPKPAEPKPEDEKP